MASRSLMEAQHQGALLPEFGGVGGVDIVTTSTASFPGQTYISGVFDGTGSGRFWFNVSPIVNGSIGLPYLRISLVSPQFPPANPTLIETGNPKWGNPKRRGRFRSSHNHSGPIRHNPNRSRPHRRCWPARPDLCWRRPSRLAATAANISTD